MSYVLAPLLAWLVAGSLKFAINSMQRGAFAWRNIGMGGLPSTHSCIVSTMCTLVAIREGFDNAAFGIALTVATVVIIDALDLRRKIEKHAIALNQLGRNRQDWGALRERIGHRPIEVLAGIATGIGCGFLSDAMF